MQELQQLLQRWGLNFQFSFICNDDFREKIYNVVTALSSTVADTSELFMRAIQMSNLFSDDSATMKIVKERKQRTGSIDATRQAGIGGMKIGALVKSTFDRLVGDGLIDSSEVGQLQRVEYSKKTFNINYPVLKEYDPNQSMSDQRDVNGYPRYYADLYIIHEKRYLLCNHWVEDLSRSCFEAWLNRVEGVATFNFT